MATDPRPLPFRSGPPVVYLPVTFMGRGLFHPGFWREAEAGQPAAGEGRRLPIRFDVSLAAAEAAGGDRMKSKVARWFKAVRRCAWLLCGGRTTEASFAFLARSIEGNRKRISELRNRNTELELRVWELEDHTPEEALTMAASKIETWGEAAQVAGGKP